MINSPAILSADWNAPDNVVAFTTMRRGGVSQGAYQSLNLGEHVGDDPANVKANRLRLRQVIGLPVEPQWLNQVHGTEIIELTESVRSDPTADGAITSLSDRICCVMTADCLPLFLADRNGAQVGVFHLGWRGLAAGMVAAAVSSFLASPAELTAWAGPAISQHHFEVEHEVRQRLGGPESAWRPSPNSGKYYADLYSLVGAQLSRLGVTGYRHSQYCTYADKAMFFSHRRDGISGRMASVIYKKPLN